MSNKKKGQPMPRIMSTQAAIREATSHISPLLEIESGRWSYHLWSSREAAWIPALHTDPYTEARRKRASSIAAMATDLLVCHAADADDPQLAWQIIRLAYAKDNTGTVRDRVKRTLERLQ